MRGFFVTGGPLRRGFRAQPVKVLRRCKFIGRPAHIGGKALDTTKDSFLPTTPARTRFAPSPTGYLHLGSLRTALYNYLLAKKTGGQFLLRLEDTDQSRLVDGAEPRLYEDLKWAGLSWDEGPDIGGPFGPYKQSARLATYQKHAAQLIDSGTAYRCFCTPEELDAIKVWNMENAEGGHTQYSGKCSHMSHSESERRANSGEAHCVRFKSTHVPYVHDLVYGKYLKPGKEDDFILMKRDGYPTYHFANVVDDHEMEITHVVRGAEWLTSTPRHVMLYDAFKWTPPAFAHVGLLCNSQGQKLSKRSGDIDISSFRDKNILPVALLNYSALLGWSPGRGEKGTSEVMDLDDMIDKFHLRFTKGNIRISNKLDFLQTKHISRQIASLTPSTFRSLGLLASMERTLSDIPPHADRGPFVPQAVAATESKSEGDGKFNADYVFRIIELDKKSFTSPSKYIERNAYLFWAIPKSIYSDTLAKAMDNIETLYLHDPSDSIPGAQEIRNIEKPITVPSLLSSLTSLLQEVPEQQWTKEDLERPVTALIKTIYAQPATGQATVWGNRFLRWILFADKPGPALIPSMEVLGRDEVLRRVEVAKEAAREWEKSRKEG
ncbi:glutamyl-tRNA synthetase [Xylariales sp. AK1849]|nr:glutamyl-tRNA synthetase [Xylariales sp. AK1849]